MTDNVEKKITIALSGKDDGASATLDKVIGKGNDLERTFKKVGKISGIGGFKVASDVAEGLSGELGAIGRYAGITAGVAGSVLAVNKITAAVDGAVSKIQSGEIAWGEFTNEIVKGLPLIGTIQKGLQDTAEIISGVKFAMRDAEAKAKQIDERKAVIDTNREYVFGIVREANKKADPAKAIREELDGELNYLKQILDAKFIDEERYQYARQFKIKEAEDAITKITMEANEERMKSYRLSQDIISKAEGQTSDLQFEMDQRRIRAAGRGVTADIQAIKRKADEDLKSIRDQINEAATNPNIEQGDAVRISRALQDRAGAVARDAEARSKDAIDAQYKITQDEVMSRRADAARIKREQEDASRIKAFETQQGPRTSNFDGRGQTGFFNQSKSIEDSGKKTADNTKSIADTMKTVSDNIGKLFTSGALISL